MKMYFRMIKGVLVFSLLVCLTIAPPALAYPSVSVPTDFATIQAAIDAVDPGGTVTIEDSAIYTEELVIQKSGLNIVAAPGQTPTIKYAGGNSYIIFADQPCQVGSNSGGRITIDGDRGGPGSQTHVFRAVHSAGEVRFENLEVTNVRNNQVVYPDSGSADITLSNVDIDGGGILQFGIRIDFLNSVLTLSCVNMTNCARDCIFTSNPSTGTLNIYNSVIEAGFDVVALDFGSGGNTLNVHNTLFNETGGGGAFACFYVRAPHTLNMTHSVIRCADIDGFGFYHFDDGVGQGPVMGSFDHCDFVADFPFRLLTSFNADTYAITNCNFRYGPTSSGRGQLLGGPAGGDDTITWDYNNVLSGSYGTFPIGANDIGIDPLYTNVTTGDFTYSDATVLSSDMSGGPIGSSQSYPTGLCANDLVVRVPSDFSTLQAAIDAVAPYGTIRIEDSGVYEETLDITTPGIRIEAAPCESPTLRFDGSNSHMIRNTEPVQFGSNSGGRIFLDLNNGGPGSSLDRVFRAQHTFGTAIFENLALIHARNTYIFFPGIGSNVSDVVMNNVDADGSHPTFGNIQSFPIRLDGYNSILTLNCCNFRNMARDCIFIQNPGTGTINIYNSVIEAGFDTVFVDVFAGGFTFNIDNSIINETGGGGAFSTIFVRAQATFNVTNTVIRCADIDAFGFYHFDDGAGQGPVTGYFDHCDFVADFPVRLLTSASADDYTFTNCNFVHGPTSSGRGQLLGGPAGGDDTIVWDYNNVPSGSYGTFPMGANDISIDPAYTDVAGKDFTYLEATVLISDVSGSPLGTHTHFGPAIDIPTVALDYTAGTGYEVDVLVPDTVPAAQPKTQPIQIYSQNVGNVVVSQLNLTGPNSVDFGILAIPPVVVNKFCPVCVEVVFDPTVTLPTPGLMATAEFVSNDPVNGSLTVDLVGDAVGTPPSASMESWQLYE